MGHRLVLSCQPAASRSSEPDWTDRFHYIPLDKVSFLSVTGQIRERGEYQDPPAFGAQPPNNGYFLERYLVSSDLHGAEHFRTFLQLDSDLINGRDSGPRPGIDRDKLDFNQGFVEQVMQNTTQNASTLATLPSTSKAQTAKEVIAANVQLLIEQLEAGHSEALTAYLGDGTLSQLQLLMWCLT